MPCEPCEGEAQNDTSWLRAIYRLPCVSVLSNACGNASLLRVAPMDVAAGSYSLCSPRCHAAAGRAGCTTQSTLETRRPLAPSLRWVTAPQQRQADVEQQAVTAGAVCGCGCTSHWGRWLCWHICALWRRGQRASVPALLTC